MSQQRSADERQPLPDLDGGIPVAVKQARALRSGLGLPDSLTSPELVVALRAALRRSRTDSNRRVADVGSPECGVDPREQILKAGQGLL